MYFAPEETRAKTGRTEQKKKKQKKKQCWQHEWNFSLFFLLSPSCYTDSNLWFWGFLFLWTCGVCVRAQIPPSPPLGSHRNLLEFRKIPEIVSLALLFQVQKFHSAKLDTARKTKMSVCACHRLVTVLFLPPLWLWANGKGLPVCLLLLVTSVCDGFAFSECFSSFFLWPTSSIHPSSMIIVSHDQAN